MLYVCRVETLHPLRLALHEAMMLVRAGQKVVNNECSDLESTSDFEDNGEGVVWTRSGAQVGNYIRRRTIWKHVITEVG